MKFLLETMHKTLNTGRCRTNLRKYLNCSFHDCAGLIEKNTLTSYKHLTPEIALKLITPECELWNQPFTETSTQSLGEPYWAFYWPGGQGLARYILDNPVVVKQKKVLDFGCGSGALSIAALKSGAKIAVANDVDTMAITATQVNARLNGVSPIYCSDNLVGSNLAEYDVILVGDMLYDTMHSTTISTWLMKAFLEKRTVLIGDPGRGYLDYSSVFGKSLFQLAKYELDQATKEENNGFFQANVFTLL